MKRKVIQLAAKTLVVSLPSKWAKNLGIRKGDELEVEEKDSKISISAKKDISVEKITINVKSIEERTILRWTISALQKSGYDEIEVIYEKPETAAVIHELVKDLLIGFAITEQSSNRCVIRSIAKELETEFEPILKRAFLVTLSMGESLTEYIRQKKTKELNQLLTLEQTNNQLTNFCERLLIKYGYKENRKTCFAYIIVWNLEKICDTLKEIIRDTSTKETDERITGLIEDTNKLLRLYFELYYKFSYEKLNEIVKKADETSKKAKQLLEEPKLENKKLIAHALQQTSLISSLSASTTALNS